MPRPDLARRVAAVAPIVAAINARRRARGERPILGPAAAPLRDDQLARDLRGDHDSPRSYVAAVTR